MAEVTAEVSCPNELMALGRRHLVVKDYNAAVETFTKACGLLATEYGDTADQCAEAYLWYGKALLGLYREESGVLGDGVPGSGNADEEEDDDEDENGEEDQNGEAETNGKDEKEKAGGEAPKKEAEEDKHNLDNAKNAEGETATKDEENGSNNAEGPSTSNGEGDAQDESTMNLDSDEVDNLQLAWEMLDLARSILHRRLSHGGEVAEKAKALLADAHLALGEVALESETYDKAVLDMQSCLDLQKELYRSDDRRIAETHYQIALANSLASNFEEAITHFKNAANILESRIKMLENPALAATDASVKKYSTSDPSYTIEGEIKELKELLPEIQEKIQDMMDYKAETMRRVRDALCPANGDDKFKGSSYSAFNSSSGASTSTAKPVSDISHLVKRKRKPSEEDDKPAKRMTSSK